MFRRKNQDQPAQPEPKPSDGRETSRARPETRLDIAVSLEPWTQETHAGQVDECLVVQLDAPIEGSVTGKLEDLCIQGASVRVQRRDIPALDQDHVIALRLSHADEGWEVLTPCQVRAIHRTDSNMARVGLEFVNAGNLYSQLVNDLGRYFNRRGADRVEIDPDIVKELKLRCKGARFEGHVHDVSVVGMGIFVDHVLAASVRKGSPITFSMRLPGTRTRIDGTGRVARKVAQGRFDLLGIQFDVRGATKDPHAALQYAEFVQRYLDDRLRWSA